MNAAARQSAGACSVICDTNRRAESAFARSTASKNSINTPLLATSPFPNQL